MRDMPKQSDDLSREGEPTQETKEAKIKIPIPRRGAFDRFIEGIKREKREGSSQSDSEQK